LYQDVQFISIAFASTHSCKTAFSNYAQKIEKRTKWRDIYQNYKLSKHKKKLAEK
jgi:hypothetical protein